jgi:16S rRNA G966 N2-methylase RsmD
MNVSHTPQHRPKTIRVTAIPLTSNGRGSKLTLAAWARGVGETQPKVFFSFTVHRRVRHGACFIEFSSHESAVTAHRAATEGGRPPQFEGQTLSCGWAAGKLRDHFFATLPYEARRDVQLDSHAAWSVTDGTTARRMAGAIASALGPCLPTRRGLEVYDAMACVGGNTVAFMQCAPIVGSVVASELDDRRADMLRHNIEVLQRSAPMSEQATLSSVTVLSGTDCFEYLARRDGPPLDCIFFDPPWGGPQYKTEKSLEEQVSRLQLAAAGDEAVEIVEDSDCDEQPSPAATEASTSATAQCVVMPASQWHALSGEVSSSSESDVPVRKTWADVISVLLGQLDGHSHSARTHAVALKLAADPISDAWLRDTVDGLVHGTDTSTRSERAFPFLLHFGAKVRMLVVLGNSASSGDAQGASPLRFAVNNGRLTSVVESIVQWHNGEGYREHRPSFYDFEKRRWILLKKWITPKHRTDSQT